MRVLVTGHRGYLGTLVTSRLLGRGHDVAGLDSELYRDCAVGDLPDVPARRMDVRDVEQEDVDGFDAVVHLAALSNDPLGWLDPAVTWDINHAGTVRLADLAKRAGVRRLVFTSSCSVYGDAGDAWLNEAAPHRPVTPYAASKARAERELLELADDDFSPVVLRPGTAYGASPMIRFDLVLNNLVAWATASGRVRLKSDGRSWRPLVHVADIAEAVAAVLTAPQAAVHGQAFNVGRDTENYQVRDLAEIVSRAVPGSTIAFADSAGPDPRCYRVVFSKIEALDGFEPGWDVMRGADELYEAIRRLGLSASDFEGPRFSRVEHVRALLSEGRLGQDLRWREDARP